ncbi:MAG: radical SAM protein [Bacteroidales bacterium]|nr:radical SAM protein [Bacteroidales bacterium]
MTSKIKRNYLPEFFALGFVRTKPSMVTVNLTSRCNQQCVYCEIGQGISSKRTDRLTPDDLKWIIDQMAINKIPKISLCGGEPFLFDGILDAIAYAGEKNIRCSVTTNGMITHRLNELELDILRKCKTEINISVDSFRDEIQLITRGSQGSIPNALKSIEKLYKNGIPVTVLTVISKFNDRDLFQFFKSAYEKGIKQVLFQPVICYSNYPDRRAIDDKSQFNVSVEKLDILMDELRKILKFERNHKIKTNVYRFYPWIGDYLKTAEAKDGTWFFNKILKKFYCREIDAIIDISYDGGIQPCGLALSSINIYENRQLGLIALWKSATSELREEMQAGRCRDICNGCCHHFSRNMLASIMKYPFQNRLALIGLFPLIFSRIQSRALKKLNIART